MFNFLYYPQLFVNRRGSIAVETTGVVASDTALTYSFADHAFAGTGRRGSLFVKLGQAVPTGTSESLPVVFKTNDVSLAVTKYGGVALTVADLSGTGVYELFYERDSNTLQMLTGIATATTSTTTD